MKLIVKTERGSFVGLNPVQEDSEQALRMMASGEIGSFMLETTKGKVIFGKALLTKAAFIIENDVDAEDE
jgi:hypothetical protein